MTPASLPDRWSQDATWLLQALDPRARLVRLIRMDERAYCAESFLDDRMLRPGLETLLCSLDQAIADASKLERDDARWIFHLGHVGSTLVSRLLGELDGVLAIREPRSLRDLLVAGDEQPALARTLCHLFSRSFGRDQVALVKTTSFLSEQAPLLVPPGGSVLFLYATLLNYIAGRLAGDKSVEELAARHSNRAKRLGKRGIILKGFDATDAHRAAAAWACEMTSLEAAADAMADRQIMWADFDVMLGDMAQWLDRCTKHFDFEASIEQLNELAAGPLMTRYSKALEFGYSPQFRAERLAEAMQRHKANIDAAVSELREAAKSAPLLERALKRSGQEL